MQNTEELDGLSAGCSPTAHACTTTSTNTHPQCKCMSSIPRRAGKHHTLTSFDVAGTTMASDASARTSCSWNSKQTEETCKHHHIFAKTHPRLMTFPPHSHRWGDGGTSPTHRPPAGRLPTATGTTATGCLLQREKHRLLPSTMKCQ